MKIVGIYSFNGGEKAVKKKYAKELDEVTSILTHVDTRNHKTKISKEKTIRDKILYNPRSLNAEISNGFLELGWEKSPM